MRDVRVADGTGQLDLESDDALVGAGDDEVNLAVSLAGAQVAHHGLGGLRIGLYGEGHERLEQPAEQRAVARERRGRRGAAAGRAGGPPPPGGRGRPGGGGGVWGRG